MREEEEWGGGEKGEKRGSLELRSKDPRWGRLSFNSSLISIFLFLSSFLLKFSTVIDSGICFLFLFTVLPFTPFFTSLSSIFSSIVRSATEEILLLSSRFSLNSGVFLSNFTDLSFRSWSFIIGTFSNLFKSIIILSSSSLSFFTCLSLVTFFSIFSFLLFASMIFSSSFSIISFCFSFSSLFISSIFDFNKYTSGSKIPSISSSSSSFPWSWLLSNSLLSLLLSLSSLSSFLFWLCIMSSSTSSSSSSFSFLSLLFLSFLSQLSLLPCTEERDIWHASLLSLLASFPLNRFEGRNNENKESFSNPLISSRRNFRFLKGFWHSECEPETLESRSMVPHKLWHCLPTLEGPSNGLYGRTFPCVFLWTEEFLGWVEDEISNWDVSLSVFVLLLSLSLLLSLLSLFLLLSSLWILQSFLSWISISEIKYKITSVVSIWNSNSSQILDQRFRVDKMPREIKNWKFLKIRKREECTKLFAKITETALGKILLYSYTDGEKVEKEVVE